MSQTNARTSRQIITHVHPANLLSLDNTLDRLIQGVQMKLRTNDHNVSDVQQSQTKLSATSPRYSTVPRSLDSYQQQPGTPGTDLWRNKVKLREATMHQEDLLDPELVQMQTFKKARPQSGWASILLNAALRAVFLPILYSWWRFELTKSQYFMLLTAWLISVWNLNCYFDSEFRLNNQISTSRMIFDIELLGPAIYLFLLSFTYCHIHNARNRASLATSQQGISGSSREKHGNCLQRDLSKRSGENNNATSNNTAWSTGRTSLSSQVRSAPRRDSLTRDRLTPIEDLGSVDNESVGGEESVNHSERNSVSSQEEHQHFAESSVTSRELDGRNEEDDRGNEWYASDERFEQENLDFSLAQENSTSYVAHVTTSQRHVTDVNNFCNSDSLRNIGNERDSNLMSQVFVASNSNVVSAPMPSVAEIVKQLEKEQARAQASFTAPMAPLNEEVEYSETISESSAMSVPNILQSYTSGGDDQPVSSLSSHLSHVESFISSNARKQSVHQSPSGAGLDTGNAPMAPEQLEAESSVLFDSFDPFNVDFKSEPPFWSSNPAPIPQSGENWESKSQVGGNYSSESTVIENRSIHEQFQSVYQNPLQVDLADDMALNTRDSTSFDTAPIATSFDTAPTSASFDTVPNNYGSTSFSGNFREFRSQTISSNFKTDEGLANTIPCQVSGVRKEKRSKLSRKRSQKTSTSSSGTGKCGVVRVKRVGSSSIGRASFLPKRVVCYLKELENAAEKASAKSNTAQLTWQEVILRFLVNCRIWLSSFCRVIKRKLLLITGRRQSQTSANECVRARDSSLPNRKTSSGSARSRRARDEQEMESDEDDDNANISDVSEEEAEETAGSSIEETEDYDHRQTFTTAAGEPSRQIPSTCSIDTTSVRVDQSRIGAPLTPGLASAGDSATCNLGPTNSSVNNTSSSNGTGSEKTVTIITWNQLGKCSKADVTAEQVCDVIVNRADSIRNSNFYLMFGTFCAILISCIPFLYRYYSMPGYRVFSDLYQFVALTTTTASELSSSCLIRDSTYLTYLSQISTFLICVIFFLLLATAERTYLQRYYYSKYLYRLTSSKKARKCEIPHFRLTKVRNIKMWLHIRFKLKAHGSQKTVEAIVSSCLLFCILSISLISFKLLEDIQMSSSKGNTVASALVPGSMATGREHKQSTTSPPGKASVGTTNEDHLVFVMRSNSHITSWIAITWCLALGFFLLRYITIGTKVNKKYSNTAMLTTERINLSLRMETKPEKREEYILADRVLKLACRLIAEVESPFKVSGLVMNSALYNLMRVILLSALSAAFSEMLGFNPKLWKV